MANAIEVDLTVDTSKAKKGLKSFEKNAVSSASNMKTAMLGVGAAVGAIVTGFAIGKLVRGFGTVTDAASIQEDAINSLNTALALSGKFSVEASEDLQAYASELQSVTKFGDEAILSTMSLIQGLGQLDSEGLKKATKASLDLSAALGIDLNAATLLVGKAAAGEVSSFSRYGLIIKKGATEAETFARALDGINTKFGGAAAAQVNTYSGAVKQAGNSFGDLQEELGFVFTKNKAIIEIVKKAGELFRTFGKIIADNRETIRGFVNEGIIFLAKGFSFAVGAVQTFNDGFSLTKLLFEGGANLTLRLGKNILKAAQSMLIFVGATDKAAALNSEIEIFNTAIKESGKEMDVIVAKNRERNALLEEFKTASLQFEEEVVLAAQSTEDAKTEVLKNAEINRKEVILATNEERILALQDVLTEEEFLRLQFAQKEASDEQSKQLVISKIKAAEAKKREKNLFKSQTAQQKINDFFRSKEVQQVQSSLGMIAGLMSSSNKTLFRLGQGAAISNAIVSTALGVVRTLSLGFPLGMILAPLVAAAGAVQIATIASQKPPSSARAGLDFVPQDNMTFVASRGERIVDSQANKDLKEFLREPDKSSAGAGNVITVNFNGDMLGDSEETKEAVANVVADAFEFQNVKREFVGAIS